VGVKGRAVGNGGGAGEEGNNGWLGGADWGAGERNIGWLGGADGGGWSGGEGKGGFFGGREGSGRLGGEDGDGWVGFAGVAVEVGAVLAARGGVLQVAQLAQFFEMAAGGLDLETEVVGDALDGGVTQAVGHLAVAPDDAVDGGGDQAQFAGQEVADGGEGSG